MAGYKYAIAYRKGTTYGRAGRTIIPKNKAIEGEWNIIDDRSGFKIKSSQATLTWDGFVVDAKDWDEERTPQDFVRAVRDQKPLPHQFTRPDVAERNFGFTTEADLINFLLRKG